MNRLGITNAYSNDRRNPYMPNNPVESADIPITICEIKHRVVFFRMNIIVWQYNEYLIGEVRS
jgi:hypothetical protein